MREDNLRWYEADILRQMDAPMQKEWWRKIGARPCSTKTAGAGKSRQALSVKIALDAPTIKASSSSSCSMATRTGTIPNFHVDWWNYFTGPDKNVMIAALGSCQIDGAQSRLRLAIGLFQNHPFQFKVSRTYDLAVEKLQQAKEPWSTTRRSNTSSVSGTWSGTPRTTSSRCSTTATGCGCSPSG